MSRQHRRLALILAAVLVAVAGPVAAGTLLAYVTNIGDDSISVVDVDALLPVATFAVGDRPVDVIVSADRAALYVSRVDGMVEMRSRSDGALLTAVQAGIQAQELLLAPTGDRLYVAGADALGGAVMVLAGSDLAPLGRIALPSSGFGLALSPDGARLYASAPSSDLLVVVDTGTDTGLGSIAVGDSPQGVAVAADGARVYAGTTGAQGVATLSVVDAGSGLLIDQIRFGSAPLTFPFFIALAPTRAHVTVGHTFTGAYQALGVVDLTAGSALPGLDVGSNQAAGIELLADGRLLVVAGGALRRLLVFDAGGPTLLPLGGVDLGFSPRGLAVLDTDAVFADGFEG